MFLAQRVKFLFYLNKSYHLGSPEKVITPQYIVELLPQVYIQLSDIRNLSPVTPGDYTHTIEWYSKFKSRHSRRLYIQLSDIRNLSPVTPGDYTYKKYNSLYYMILDLIKYVNILFKNNIPTPSLPGHSRFPVHPYTSCRNHTNRFP